MPSYPVSQRVYELLGTKPLFPSPQSSLQNSCHQLQWALQLESLHLANVRIFHISKITSHRVWPRIPCTSIIQSAHLKAINACREALLDALSPLSEAGTAVVGGEGAIYLWAKLPEGTLSAILCLHAESTPAHIRTLGCKELMVSQ